MKWLTEMMFNGGKQKPKIQKKSNSLVSQISKLASYFIKKLKILRCSNHGAILIEFAVCIPILIIAILYIHDIVKIKRYYSQTEFAGQQMINIIQNISQKRTNQRITYQDFKLALHLASLSFYPEKTMASGYSEEEGPDYIQYPCITAGYTEGEGGKASIKSFFSTGAKYTYPQGPKDSPFQFMFYHNTIEYRTIGFNMGWREVDPTDIYPTLKIQDDEEKIILESFIVLEPKKEQTIDVKKVFGLFLLNPKILGRYDKYQLLFRSVLIFKLKKGLFDSSLDWGWFPYTPYFWYDTEEWSSEDWNNYYQSEEWQQYLQHGW